MPSINGGGMERVMVELANYFVASKGANISIVLLGRAEKFYSFDDRIEIIEPPFAFNKKYRVYHTLKTLWYLRKTVRAMKPAVLLSFGERWNNFVLLALLFVKVKKFVSDRSSPEYQIGAFHNFLRKYLYKTAYGLIAQTGEARDNIAAIVQHKNITVIGNPVRNLSINRPAANENIILNVGRFDSTKKQKLLIEIFAAIDNEGWKLVLVGDGLFYEKAKKKMEELNMAGKVEFVGPSKNVDQYYSSSTIFAFPSILEGFPNALAEAMASPLACIAYDCLAGPKDIIDDNINGFLIPVNDEEGFKQKLQQLMKDEALREKFKSNAQQKMKQFNLQHIGDLYYATLNA